MLLASRTCNLSPSLPSPDFVGCPIGAFWSRRGSALSTGGPPGCRPVPVVSLDPGPVLFGVPTDPHPLALAGGLGARIPVGVLVRSGPRLPRDVDARPLQLPGPTALDWHDITSCRRGNWISSVPRSSFSSRHPLSESPAGSAPRR